MTVKLYLSSPRDVQMIAFLKGYKMIPATWNFDTRTSVHLALFWHFIPHEGKKKALLCFKFPLAMSTTCLHYFNEKWCLLLLISVSSYFFNHPKYSPLSLITLSACFLLQLFILPHLFCMLVLKAWQTVHIRAIKCSFNIRLPNPSYSRKRTFLGVKTAIVISESEDIITCIHFDMKSKKD